MLVVKDGDSIAGYSMSAEEMIGIAEQPMVATDPDALATWLRKPLFQHKVEARVVQLAEAERGELAGQIGSQPEAVKRALPSPVSASPTSQDQDEPGEAD